jgi:hypothetical protein
MIQRARLEVEAHINQSTAKLGLVNLQESQYINVRKNSICRGKKKRKEKKCSTS